MSGRDELAKPTVLTSRTFSSGVDVQESFNDLALLTTVPTQSTVLQTPFVYPLRLASSSFDGTTSAVSSESYRSAFSPELNSPKLLLAGPLEFGVAEDVERNYFSGEFNAVDEVAAELLDSVFQETGPDAFEFGSFG